jgi:hypothetical protein
MLPTRPEGFVPFPSEEYTGFKPSPFESGPHIDHDCGLDDGSTYN